LGVWFLQQQEDEEMLVPHTDLPENNHQPMEGTCCFLTLLIRRETPAIFVTLFIGCYVIDWYSR